MDSHGYLLDILRTALTVCNFVYFHVVFVLKLMNLLYFFFLI